MNRSDKCVPPPCPAVSTGRPLQRGRCGSGEVVSSPLVAYRSHRMPALNKNDQIVSLLSLLELTVSPGTSKHEVVSPPVRPPVEVVGLCLEDLLHVLL